jgi:hypothetical protein
MDLEQSGDPMKRSITAITSALLLVACGDDGATGSGGGGPGAGTISVQISGEDAGTDGFLFPTGSEVTISDGWEIHFDHVFVTVGSVWLSENPDTAPADQSKTGDMVAKQDGPWAVDLAIAGTAVGAGGEGTAVPLVAFETMNLKGDAPFAADQRYAFSYALVAASSSATKVNFEDDAAASSAYESAVTGGCSVVYVGTATFKGTDCESSDATYDFTAIPTTVPFRLCFATPTDYVNCQNEANQGDPFPDEEFQRGIPIQANEASTAQITMHLEHPFYSDVQHEPRLYFDQLAAALVGQPAGTELTLDLVTGIDPTGFTDGAGQDLPWRACDGSTVPSGQRAFSSGSIPVGPGQDPSNGFRDYVDFVDYVQSTQGHLNGGEGLCYIDRQYPSPQ